MGNCVAKDTKGKVVQEHIQLQISSCQLPFKVKTELSVPISKHGNIAVGLQMGEWVLQSLPARSVLVALSGWQPPPHSLYSWLHFCQFFHSWMKCLHSTAQVGWALLGKDGLTRPPTDKQRNCTFAQQFKWGGPSWRRKSCEPYVLVS